MKKTAYLILPVLFFVAGLTGCKKDEAGAPPIIDDLNAYPGKYRAKLEFAVPAAARTGKVFYGSGNFEEFTVSDGSAAQHVVIEDLPEQEHIFRVVTINADGLVSDPRGIKVKVYGENYENTLKPRKWTDQITHSPTSIELLFDAAEASETGVRVVFTKTSGAKDSVLISNTQQSAELNDINTEEPYYYYSVFKPQADAIDEFYSVNVDGKEALMMDFKKESWTIAGFSDEEAGKSAELIIDNDIHTAWHSQVSGAQPGFPHWITVDMGSPKLIAGFYYVNFQGNGRSTKDIRFEVSDDNSNWTLVLETEVKDNFLRQQLPLAQPVAAQYFRVTAVNSWHEGASTTQFAEIDAYNIQNQSGANGRDEYTNTSQVALANATKPFQGDGSNPFPALGDYRMQKLTGWTHSPSAVVSYDNSTASFSLFCAPVWGLAPVVNGKVYQTVSLQPGLYSLKMDVGATDGPVDIYGVVANDATLPDYTAVTSSATTVKYVNLAEHQREIAEMMFAVTEASEVTIGVVYNTYDQYGATGLPWTSFGMNGFELAKLPE